MQLSDYQKQASRTLPEGVRDELLKNMGLGIAGESGELVDIIKKIVYHGHPLDWEMQEKIIYELGDCLWYISQIAEVLDISMDAVAHLNIKKLQKRYPKSFNTTDSIRRVDVND